MSPADAPLFSTLWTRSVQAPARGVALARERSWILAWDQTHWLYLFDHCGHRQAQIRPPSDVVHACSADDGSAYVAIGAGGEIWWLTPDLTIRWQLNLTPPLVAVALDPFGQYLAVSDQRGVVHLFTCLGQMVATVQSPRPIHHLAFVPTAPLIAASADFGLVGAFDLTGQWHWRDAVVVNVGGLATSGGASQILLACFSHGLQGYGKGGENLGRIPVDVPCRLVSATFDGQRLLVADMGSQLILCDRAGHKLAGFSCPAPVAALALSALGDHTVVGLTDGSVHCLGIKSRA